MKTVDDDRWEIVRRQVALCGQVSMPAGGPPLRDVEDVEVRLLAGPAARSATATLRPHGVFFFLDLPPGRYTIAATAARGRWRQEGAGSVSWDASGRVRPAVVHLELTRRT